MRDEELAKILADIIRRITELEDKVSSKSFSRNFTNLYDDYLFTYLDNVNIINILDKNTKKVYMDYVKNRIEKGMSEETIPHIRTFNKAVRKRFPDLKIKHLTRNGENVYIWKAND